MTWIAEERGIEGKLEGRIEGGMEEGMGGGGGFLSTAMAGVAPAKLRLRATFAIAGV